MNLIGTRRAKASKQPLPAQSSPAGSGSKSKPSIALTQLPEVEFDLPVLKLRPSAQAAAQREIDGADRKHAVQGDSARTPSANIPTDLDNYEHPSPAQNSAASAPVLPPQPSTPSVADKKAAQVEAHRMASTMTEKQIYAHLLEKAGKSPPPNRMPASQRNQIATLQRRAAEVKRLRADLMAAEASKACFGKKKAIASAQNNYDDAVSQQAELEAQKASLSAAHHAMTFDFSPRFKDARIAWQSAGENSDPQAVLEARREVERGVLKDLIENGIPNDL